MARRRGLPIASPSICPSLPPLHFQIRSAGCSPGCPEPRARAGLACPGCRYLPVELCRSGAKRASAPCRCPLLRRARRPALPRHRWSSPFLIAEPAAPPAPDPLCHRQTGQDTVPSWHSGARLSRRAPRAVAEPEPRSLSALHPPTSVHCYPSGRGRGAKPPTAQLWGPEIDLERSKSALKPRLAWPRRL